MNSFGFTRLMNSYEFLWIVMDMPCPDALDNPRTTKYLVLFVLFNYRTTVGDNSDHPNPRPPRFMVCVMLVSPVAHGDMICVTGDTIHKAVFIAMICIAAEPAFRRAVGRRIFGSPAARDCDDLHCRRAGVSQNCPATGGAFLGHRRHVGVCPSLVTGINTLTHADIDDFQCRR